MSILKEKISNKIMNTIFVICIIFGAIGYFIGGILGEILMAIASIVTISYIALFIFTITKKIINLLKSEWFKENWLKIIIAISFLIIAASVLYYFLLYIPNKEKLANEIKCMQEGLKVYEKQKEIEMQNESSSSFYFHNPEFKFKNNTCYMKMSFVYYPGTGDINDNQYIINVYTNDIISSSSGSFNAESFKKIYNKIFNN